MKVKRPKNFSKNYSEAVEQRDEKKTLKHKESNVLYKPMYERYLKTAAIVLVSLVAVFFVELNAVPIHVMREIDSALTPCLSENTSTKVALK